MRNTRITVTLGQAAEKNGQELGLINEENLLKCIKQEDWIREEEASLLTGLSQQMVGKVGRRLAAKDEIYRERVHGNAGYFLRLKVGGLNGSMENPARTLLFQPLGGTIPWQFKF